MNSLLIIGECMMELNTQSSNAFSYSFAGDTYNTAVYAKRWQSSLKVSYLTSVGTDATSEKMLDSWSEESIDASLVLTVKDKQPGIYLITTDDDGERTFNYWRKDSAATKLITALEQRGGIDSVPDFDYVYFSGISLAILSDKDKTILLDLVTTLRERGAKIAFDPNYRATMWHDEVEARLWIERAYQCCDMVLPGLDEHQLLFAHNTPQEVRDHLQQFSVVESVVKCGELGICCYGLNDSFIHLPFTPAKVQVDTTAAGDSFAGTYLASRIAGESRGNSLKNAASVAGFVVQHKGAIVDKALYQQFISSLDMAYDE
ncbi:sugar kinase [Thalassotalea fonticola]|uniref:Sugar kinase n=1 Tax=Thalassotalea fonticola TaxID=3065649 RepID=A0ABZ0GK07_9GAMM|nr:sugar kinase [Colwelliaceae bacterium S1-1]